MTVGKECQTFKLMSYCPLLLFVYLASLRKGATVMFSCSLCFSKPAKCVAAHARPPAERTGNASGGD